ncbi:unnamed protein product [Didymodactylos carnosus]|uniref:Amino acid permease n=1 Tax=Didymodactylos carnosus TaxID=1234261 RepID=A0A8S2GJG9_9BILA|nr:unnamed protein product [Didymodactylos carnosus]CAF3525985.1 unnamed protein product [Didymodactylos carnosus]
MQWVFTVVKFLPILMVPIFGFIGSNSNIQTLTEANLEKPVGLGGVAPAIGIIGSIPAIFFAFDGFYAVGSIKENMRQPKKLGPALVIGIAIITGAYLLISAGLFTSSPTGTAGDILKLPE